MKKLAEHYKLKLLDQAVPFYYSACRKQDTTAIEVRKDLSSVGPKFIHLRNAFGAEVWARHTSTYLFVQVAGREFSEKIKL